MSLSEQQLRLVHAESLVDRRSLNAYFRGDKPIRRVTRERIERAMRTLGLAPANDAITNPQPPRAA